VTARYSRPVRIALACALFPLLFPVRAFAQSDCAQLEEVHLRGVVDGAPVRLYLRAGYPAVADDGLYGVLIYVNTWLPGGDSEQSRTIELEGTLSAACELKLEERTFRDEVLREWSLRRGADGRFAGTRTSLPARIAMPVVLQVAGPVDCSGAGRWVKYTEPGMPVSFEYPVSWRVWKHEDYTQLGCPDPKSIALDRGDIFVSYGLDTPDTPDAGASPREIERFHNFGNSQWWYGDCEGTADDATSLWCARARQSTRLGMTVLLGAAGENRRYRPYGGYMGQGEPALNYLFLFSGHWVHVQESDGDDAPDFEKPGPVVFNGDSVVRRLVRSVRPATP
jgi:hypothetical protein